MPSLTPFQESIRILADTISQIQWATAGIMKSPSRLNDENLKKTICFRILQLVSIFMEEWKQLGMFAKRDETLRKTLRAVSPAIDHIKKWGNLDKVRNRFLAHPHRDKQRAFVTIKELFEDPHVPTSWAEMLFLGKCAEIASQWLFNIYWDDYLICSEWLKLQGVITEGKGVRTLEQVNEELKLVNSAINKRIDDTGLRKVLEQTKERRHSTLDSTLF